MESTGVYWIAPFQILEAKGIEVFLVNARFVKNVQGRQSDMLDCQWIRLLHSYGLLPKSRRPAAQIAVRRSYLRHRQMLVQYAASHIQHMQKGADADACADSPCHLRYHRIDGHADHPSHG